MNLSHFIAKRLAFSDNKSFTKIIIRFAIASVALSLATMILTSAILDGFKTEISTKVYGFWGHIHITDTNINRSFEQIPISKSEPYLEEIKEIAQVDYLGKNSFLGFEMDGLTEKTTKGGIHHMQPVAIVPGIISTSDEFGAILLKGIDDNFDWDYNGGILTEGKQITYEAEPSDGIVISKVTAAALQLKVGQKVIIRFVKDNEQVKRRFTITGIYNTGLEEYDERFAFADLRKVQEILGWTEDQVSGIEVFLDDVNDVEVMNEYLYDIIPIKLYSETINRKFPSIFEWLKLQDINMVLILVLMIIVSVINMMTALLILILERSGMIGTLKTLGASNWEVRKIFIFHAAYIILIGLLIGNFIGLALYFIQDHYHILKLDEASYYLSYAPVLLSWWKLIALNVLCFFMILLFLFIPSVLITKISPVKVLRFG